MHFLPDTEKSGHSKRPSMCVDGTDSASLEDRYGDAGASAGQGERRFGDADMGVDVAYVMAPGFELRADSVAERMGYGSKAELAKEKTAAGHGYRPWRLAMQQEVGTGSHDWAVWRRAARKGGVAGRQQDLARHEEEEEEDTVHSPARASVRAPVACGSAGKAEQQGCWRRAHTEKGVGRDAGHSCLQGVD